MDQDLSVELAVLQSQQDRLEKYIDTLTGEPHKAMRHFELGRITELGKAISDVAAITESKLYKQETR